LRNAERRIGDDRSQEKGQPEFFDGISTSIYLWDLFTESPGDAEPSGDSVPIPEE